MYFLSKKLIAENRVVVAAMSKFTFSCPLFCMLWSSISIILDSKIQNNGQLKVN